ncbi:MAG TPA: heme-binding beta-barrel domain-containing protein [Acidimicrobiales bacterium]
MREPSSSWASTVIARTATAKDVSSLVRRIAVAGDALTYSLEMAAVGIPLGFHRGARLRRTDPGTPE